MSWAVYIIEAENGKLYTGITTDTSRRFKEHLEGGVKAAKFFRTSPPRRLIYEENCSNRSSASKRESLIKKMTLANKRDLINQVKKHSS